MLCFIPDFLELIRKNKFRPKFLSNQLSHKEWVDLRTHDLEETDYIRNSYGQSVYLHCKVCDSYYLAYMSANKKSQISTITSCSDVIIKKLLS